MTAAQRWLIAGTLCVLAIGLAWHFIEYRAEDMRVDAKMNRVVPPGLILPIREGTRKSYFHETPKPPEGFEITTQQGIYARPDYATTTAAIGGLLIPVLLLAGAGYLALGGHRASN